MKKYPQSDYRPDIDGIRAIAILSVILFHINSHLIPGGFAGVDIFFVISGFLISQHILRDIEHDKFSLIEFYRRRVKRLALPLLLVVFLTLLIAFVLMIPDDFKQAADSGLYSLLSLANVFFWLFQDTSYFATDSKALPLLHLWSLGVEEQFYIFWPLILMLSYRRSRTIIFFVIATILAIVSFVFGEFWFQRDASFVYYMLPARAGELLVGTLVAISVLRGVENRLPKSFAAPMAGLGLLLLVLSFALLNEDQVFPGFRALLPTLGTAFLLLARHCAMNPVSTLLASGPLVGVGLISYSAYLWHWPLLAFLRYEHVTIGILAGVIVFVLTIWLAFLSYMLVELPAREWDTTSVRIFLFQYAAPSCLIAVLLFAGKIYLGSEVKAPIQEGISNTSEAPSAIASVPERSFPSIQAASSLVAHQASTITNVKSATGIPPKIIQPMSELDTGLHDKPRPAYEFNYVCMPDRVTPADMKLPRCIFGANSTQPPGVILWGDSNASHYIGVVGAIARSAGFNVRNMTVYSCPPLSIDPAPYVVAKRLDACRSSAEAVLTSIHAAQAVILAAHWPDYMAHSNHFLEDFFVTVKTLTAEGKFVVIMGKAPVINSFDIDCREKALNAGAPLDCDAKEPLTADVIDVNAKLKNFAGKTPNVSYFDITSYLCKGGICSSTDAAGNPLYLDTGHLSVAASWKIGESILRQEGIPEPFARIREWLGKSKANTQVAPVE